MSVSSDSETDLKSCELEEEEKSPKIGQEQEVATYCSDNDDSVSSICEDVDVERVTKYQEVGVL